MISKKTFDHYAESPAAFRADLMIDVDGTARRFGAVMDDWQRDDFAALDGALMRAAGRSDEPATMRTWLERPRGHSKTSDLAAICCWCLAFSTRPIRAFAYGADKDQSKLLRDAIETLLRLNPWLGEILRVQSFRVVNVASGHPGEGGTLTIEASDVGSSYGILADVIVADELVHWPGDDSLWTSLISSAAKRTCLLCTISNAGFADSWQWRVRETARTDEAWLFSRLDGPKASWLSSERLDEQRRMLPPVAYSRLWENQWSSGGGDALTPADIEQAFDDSLSAMTGRQDGTLFVAGVDLGLTRDCSSVIVLAVPSGGAGGNIRLAHAKLWRPMLGRKIDLLAVQRHLLELDQRFGLEVIAFDPWQAEHLAQTLEVDSDHRRRNAKRRYSSEPWLKEIPPTVANLREQATLVLESFADRRLRLFDYQPLRQDLGKVRVEERSRGNFRLTSPRDGEGHGDSFSAFALALLVAHDIAGRKPISVGVLWTENTGDVGGYEAQLRREEFETLGGPEIDEGFRDHFPGLKPFSEWET